MVKSLAASLLILAGGTMWAAADEVVIEHERPAVVEHHVTVEKSAPGGCDTKTVHKEGVEGSTTVKKEHCD
jgi:hypothetical protein